MAAKKGSPSQAPKSPTRTDAGPRHPSAIDAKVELSVVIPTCNRTPYLEKALISLSAQDLDPERFEVIVVDYGDPNSTRAAFSLPPTGKAPLQIRHELLKGNGAPYRGLTRARNQGTRVARGWLVAFMPPECLLTPSSLRLCLEVHKSSEVDLVTTVRPWSVSEKALKEIDKAEWRKDASNLIRTFQPPDVQQNDQEATWGDMHFGAVKKKWAGWIGGHNERFETWGYESIDFTERLCIYAVEYLEITDERVGVFHLWHPVSPEHGNRHGAVIERLLNSYTRETLLKNLRSMHLLSGGAGAGLHYDQMKEFLGNLPVQTLNNLLVRMEKDYESTVLPAFARMKKTHRPGSELLGAQLWPGLQHAGQWGDHAVVENWLDWLAKTFPDDPAPLLEKAKFDRLTAKPVSVSAEDPSAGVAAVPAAL
ncbi:MAG: glycosyltransferase family 2 protein [Nitrospirae bacterium]|nr:glycosyltransferase family 2 protein [Nitrospirota bacterium]